MNQDQQRQGIEEFSRRLAKSGLSVLEESQPWPNRRAVYFEIGNDDRRTSIVLTDEFVRDLPATREYQAAVDSYATAVSGRIRCGAPDLFYCRSNIAVNVSITWPIQAAVVGNTFSSWLLTDVTNEADGLLARCCVNLERQFTYSGRTIFDDVRSAINRIRTAIDGGDVTFYDKASHPDRYQRAGDDARRPTEAASPNDVERFIAGKAYMLSFHLPDLRTEAFVADPWDAEYLGVSQRDLSRSAQVLRARGLINLDLNLSFARPSDKLISLGWPAAIDPPPVAVPIVQVFQLSRLPKKEELLSELKNSLTGGSEVAVVVLDLDHFKQVNDSKGHAEGDACLEKVVRAIGSALGRKGTLYRWGGDEFAITLPNFSTEEAGVTAERIRKAIEQAKAGKDITVTASVGVSATDVLQGGAEVLLDAADKAMYVSKKNGKNRVTLGPLE